ncbi:hypothetical protein FIBSPDRAFT_970289 [Athelia psychrophila]|uniref:DUF6533 domain-containing protein n=1 Tax=Athelia psychrophila TaxID=1759441 RepID=A0A167SSN7_9AGAM|nr:hypothetical protein FIBSPDRAFT_970289 [Fibularhizoctonia sp. CBS 109695]
MRVDDLLNTVIHQLYTYDWLLCISEEYEILSKAGLSKSNMVYFMSRIGEFGHQLTNALLLCELVTRYSPLFRVNATLNSSSSRVDGEVRLPHRDPWDVLHRFGG